MAKFIYTVQDAQGTVTTGNVAADNEDQAVGDLQNRGLFILSIQAEQSKPKGLFDLNRFSKGSVSGRELVFLVLHSSRIQMISVKAGQFL